MTLIYPPFYIAPLAVASPWHLLCSLYSYPLLLLDSDHLPILLTIPFSPVFRPNERPPSFNFQKACWDDFVYNFDSHCPTAEEYSSLSLSSAVTFFISLTLNAAKSFISFGRNKRHSKAWRSADVEEAVSERLRLSSPLTKKWRSARARSPLRSRARGYLSELHRATCPEKSHSSFCSPSPPLNFLQLSQTLPHPLPLAQTKLLILRESTFLALALIFFFTFSTFCGLYIPFLPSGRHLPLFPSTRWESLSILLLPSGLSLSLPSYQSCLNASFYPVYSSFWNPIPFSLPARPPGLPGRSTLDQILYLSQSVSDGFNKPRPGLRTILSTIDFSKAFDSVWHPALFHKLISAGLPPCFARWTQSFLSDRRACVVY